ncbi:MAG: DNA topoisomerase IV subunit A [Varibaculum sp.]|nr:DNA topoisomerase IV subunit A [Varibaculum sp.]
MTVAEKIVDIDVSTEMRTSFLEYAYSVIHARALPDARDGLKPVQRRILYQMGEMGLDPKKGHVKSSRVVGEVMGKLHPHGDSAIYDAIVRLAQPFAMRVPLVDGHGNFGSLDDGPAAARYTEVRLAPAALEMISGLDEDVVDFVPNYDNQLTQPAVLPAGFPNMLVNGATGIAVGMATNIPPHNLSETINAACHLSENPEAETEELMRYLPGPDFPGGGVVIGLDGIREAYESGRGLIKVRAKCSIERVSARKRGIVVTELPYQVGPEKVIDKIKDAINHGRIKGISNVLNLTDRDHEMRLIIEVKNGVNPEAVLKQLYKHTPMEDTFGVNAVALVDGKPQTLGLKRILEVFLDHRENVVRRRTEYRLAQAKEQLHLVEGLLIAVLDIDGVIQIIRASEDAAQAKDRLMMAFDLDDVQAEHILALRLRRLTKFSTIELQNRRDELVTEIADLQYLLSDRNALLEKMRTEMRELAATYSDPRRTVLMDGDSVAAAEAAAADVPLDIPDEPCTVVLGGLQTICRFPGTEAIARTGARVHDDALLAALLATSRGEIGLIGADGNCYRTSVVEIPSLPRTEGAPSLHGATPIRLLRGIEVPIVGLLPLNEETAPVWLVTAGGVVKLVRPEHPGSKDEWPLINLEDTDRVIAGGVSTPDSELFLISAAGQLLRTSSDAIRPQGRSAGGVAGMKLSSGDRVIAAAQVPKALIANYEVVTVAGDGGLLPGTGQTSAKRTPAERYPAKGRATQGVRCQRLLRGEDALQLAAVVPAPPRAISADAGPVELPELDERRDGSGTKITHQIAAIG